MTTQPAFDPEWLQALRASAVVPPLRPRVPLWAGQSVIGSVEPGLLNQKALHDLLDAFNEAGQLLKEEHPLELGACRALGIDSEKEPQRGQFLPDLQAHSPAMSQKAGEKWTAAALLQPMLPKSGRLLGWRLLGDVTISLNLLARALHGAGLAGEWRNEQLAVHDQFDHLKGTVERAAVRPLGIATAAVHLAGQTPDGRHWVQQRSHKKSNDPGLWDTLMGGMVSSLDTVETALERETWEEAGLKMATLQNVTHGGRVLTRRPSFEGNGAGYVIEDIDWYRCTVPEGVMPVNQDGEVEQFRLMEVVELVAALQRGEFTTEATLILVEVLEVSQLPTP